MNQLHNISKGENVTISFIIKTVLSDYVKYYNFKKESENNE